MRASLVGPLRSWPAKVPSTDTFSVGPFLVYRIRDPKGRRLGQLLTGLVIFGASLGVGIEAVLGVSPWTVFHDGLSQRLPLSIGLVTSLVGFVLLLIYPAIDEPIGIGTLCNAIVIGPVIDATLYLIPDLTELWVRVVALGLTPVGVGLGSGLYIGANLGPGPRDGIMTALERRGVPIWMARTGIELSVIVAGTLLGGDLGWGTIWIAVTLGFFVQYFLQRLRIDQSPNPA